MKAVTPFLLTLLLVCNTFSNSSDSTFEHNREAFQKEVQEFHSTYKPKRIEFNEGPTQPEKRDLPLTNAEKQFFANKKIEVNREIKKEISTEFQILRLDWGLLGDGGGKSLRFASSMGFINPALNYKSETSSYAPQNFFRRRRALVSANPFLGYVKEKRKHSNTIFRMVQLGMGVQITSKHHKWNTRLAFLKGKEDQLQTVNGYAVSTSFAPMNRGVGMEITYSDFRQTTALSLSFFVEASDLLGKAIRKGKAKVAEREAMLAAKTE